MAKSPLEKQLEKQAKQNKQLADRQHRDEQKRAREQDRLARKEAIRQQAASIVNGRPFVAGLRIMDETSEDILNNLLQYEMKSGNQVNFENDIFPDYVQISLELEKLVQYGMISGLNQWMGGGILHILPQAFSYFHDKENALKRQKDNQEQVQIKNIVNYGNFVFGNVTASTLSVDNSVQQIERAIEEQGGKDKEDLMELFEEVKELIENMESSRSIPKQKKLFQRLTDHMSKHGWFYGAVIQLLGTAAMTMLGA